MTVTEEQAKTKWCPHSRMTVQAGESLAGVNRPDENHLSYENCHCIGSGCMMWVWEVTRTAGTYAGRPPRPVLGEDLPREAWQGRCGLTKP